jgi:hypothetical protein
MTTENGGCFNSKTVLRKEVMNQLPWSSPFEAQKLLAISP